MSFFRKIMNLLQSKSSFIWGAIITLLILLLYQLLKPLYATLRQWWEEFFRNLGISYLFYPGMELILTIAALYIVGRLFLLVRSDLASRAKVSGVQILFERVENRFYPGIASGIIYKDPESDFPHEYLVKIYPPPRGVPEPILMSPETIWVVSSMPADEFIKMWVTASVLMPDKLPKDIMRWDKWQSQRCNS